MVSASSSGPLDERYSLLLDLNIQTRKLNETGLDMSAGCTCKVGRIKLRSGFRMTGADGKEALAEVVGRPRGGNE